MGAVIVSWVELSCHWWNHRVVGGVIMLWVLSSCHGWSHGWNRHVGGGVIVLRVASTCCGWSHHAVGCQRVKDGVSVSWCLTPSKYINNALSINTSYGQKHFVCGTHQL